MSDEPILPPIPAIGDVLTRKKNMKEFKTSILKCNQCGSKSKRPFEEGDYVFKEFSGKKCSKCGGTTYTIIEIFAEFKKSKSKK
ncbi:MAG: hypothetical protein ACTSU2_15075 [Promethearchaeota archaeon]